MSEKQPTNLELRSFYESYGWRKARYLALKLSSGRCELCGASRKSGAILNVDHIKPVRTHWGLRTTQENLQVLCGECNHGKGNWDETDWRSPDCPRSITQTDEHIARFGSGFDALAAGRRIRAKRQEKQVYRRKSPPLFNW